MVHVIGWVGVILLVLTYTVLLSNKTTKFFTYLNILASATLTLYAVLIHDAVFSVVNGFITLVLVYRVLKKQPVE